MSSIPTFPIEIFKQKHEPNQEHKVHHPHHSHHHNHHHHHPKRKSKHHKVHHHHSQNQVYEHQHHPSSQDLLAHLPPPILCHPHASTPPSPPHVEQKREPIQERQGQAQSPIITESHVMEPLPLFSSTTPNQERKDTEKWSSSFAFIGISTLACLAATWIQNRYLKKANEQERKEMEEFQKGIY